MKIKSLAISFFLLVAAVAIICTVVGCSSKLIEPLDFGSLYYEYDIVSDENDKYIILKRHIVSESDVKIPDSIYGVPVKEVGESAFENDKMIKSLYLGKNVEKIDKYAFSGCTSLETVTYDTALCSVGDGAFSECTALKSFAQTVSPSDILSETSAIIDNGAFFGCVSLESVQFMDNIDSIGDYAFKGCTSLKAISIPDSVNYLGRGAFYGCNKLNNIGIPDSLQNIGGRAFFGTAWLNAKKQNFVVVGNGVLIEYKGDLRKVKIPAHVKKISGAFAGNTKIESVTFNANLYSIGDMAFMGCTSLESAAIPPNVVEIGDEAFCNCKSLQISLGNGIQNIGRDAFKNCIII